MQLFTSLILALPNLELRADWSKFLVAANDPKYTILSHMPPQMTHSRAVEDDEDIPTVGGEEYLCALSTFH